MLFALSSVAFLLSQFFLALLFQFAFLIGGQSLASADFRRGELRAPILEAAVLQLIHLLHALAHAEALHFFHHRGHAIERLYELVDFMRFDARAGGDAAAARLIDHARIAAFVRRH